MKGKGTGTPQRSEPRKCQKPQKVFVVLWNWDRGASGDAATYVFIQARLLQVDDFELDPLENFLQGLAGLVIQLLPWGRETKQKKRGWELSGRTRRRISPPPAPEPPQKPSWGEIQSPMPDVGVNLSSPPILGQAPAPGKVEIHPKTSTGGPKTLILASREPPECCFFTQTGILAAVFRTSRPLTTTSPSPAAPRFLLPYKSTTQPRLKGEELGLWGSV